MSLPETLSGYWEPYVDRISVWLSDGEWLDQDAFDARAEETQRGFLQGKGPIVRVNGFRDESMIPPMGGQPYSRAYFIAVVQEMARNGLVEAREHDGKVEYRLTEAG